MNIYIRLNTRLAGCDSVTMIHINTAGYANTDKITPKRDLEAESIKPENNIFVYTDNHAEKTPKQNIMLPSNISSKYVIIIFTCENEIGSEIHLRRTISSTNIQLKRIHTYMHVYVGQC